MGTKSLMTATLAWVASMLLTFSSMAVNLTPKPKTQPESPEIFGNWTLMRVDCSNGVRGETIYEAAFLQLTPPTANAQFSHDGCDISLDGTAEQIGNEVILEFNSGSWSSCSGSLPSYVWNRFVVTGDRSEMHLVGQDLRPFGSCQGGPGELIFVNK